MKFSIEMEGDTVKYSYEVGVSKQTCETKFSVEWLCAMTSLLSLASKAWEHTIDSRKEALWTASMVSK